MLAALVESRKRHAPYTGAFLLKDEEGTESSDAEKNIYDLKGKDLFNRLHEVGTLAQVMSSPFQAIVTSFLYIKLSIDEAGLMT